jgi:hypothetical protein
MNEFITALIETVILTAVGYGAFMLAWSFLP